MDTIGMRIKKLRKSIDLTQKEFATRIGSSQNVIGNYEINHRNPSGSVINNICKTFNVSETWLRTGEGEMFVESSDSILDMMAEKYGLSRSVRVLVEEFINLKPEIQQTFVDYALKVAASLIKETETLPSQPIAEPRKKTVEEAEAEYIKAISAVVQEKERTVLNTTAANTTEKTG